jgi:Predicted metal-binding integral membrane protein (DUF2182)
MGDHVSPGKAEQLVLRIWETTLAGDRTKPGRQFAVVRAVQSPPIPIIRPSARRRRAAGRLRFPPAPRPEARRSWPTRPQAPSRHRPADENAASPLSFLAHSWRPGRLGAFRMGLQHGTYCLGCCWFLMGLPFFGGIMNLFWIAGLAGFILLEKTIPLGHWFGRIAGVCFAAWGALMLASAAGG